MKRAIKRILIVLLGLGLQLGISIFFQLAINEYIIIAKVIYWLIGISIILSILKNSTRLSSDMPWVIFISLFPVFGTIAFITFGRSYTKSKLLKRIIKKHKEYEKYLVKDNKLEKEIELKDNLKYFYNFTEYPIYKNTKLTYYDLGDKFYPELLKELKKAKDYIFMEYYIIKKGYMWDGILDILKDKAQNGVEVRIMYDDFGSLAVLPENYFKELKNYNIKCIPFNKLSPFGSMMMNNRDHRKMTIIDGRVAFTGGLNISDEYINKEKRFGKWKDNAIKIEGESIWNMTVMFLTLWNANLNEDKNILKFKYDFKKKLINPNGYVVPYGNSPFLNNYVGEDVYLNIINSAKKYVYIFTPYLIIDTDMINSLTRAARRGVDIRIIVPGIPDKKIVYSMTKSYFNILMKDKIKIYTYNPGFIHSKVFLSDDNKAVVGTLNMDYRSLYLHFENGIYMEDCREIKKIKQDLEDTIKQSKLLKNKDVKLTIFGEIWQAILRLIAPLV